MEKLGTHPNIISLHNVYESHETLYVIQDLAEGGELFDRIVREGELSEKEASKLFRGAVQAVAHLHEKHIAHLDIKPENLLLRRVSKNKMQPHTSKEASNEKPDEHHFATANIKAQNTKKNKNGGGPRRFTSDQDMEEIVALADFGLSVEDTSATDRSPVFDLCVGTPAYWSPQMVKRERYGFEADMWALGCVLYILLCGVHPFDVSGQSPEAQILAKVATGDYDKTSKEYQQLSAAAKDSLFHLLDPNPLTRYTAKQALEHPWMTSDALSTTPLSAESMTKLRGFRVLTIIKTGMLDMLGKAEAELFQSLDQNHDGFISPEELRKGLSVLGIHLDEKEIDAFLKLVDTNHDDKISKEEFDAVLVKTFEGDNAFVAEHARLEDLSTLFQAFDRNNDSYVSIEDVHHVLSLLGSKTTRSAVKNEWSGADEDGDGLISFAEFVKFVRKSEVEKHNRAGGAVSGMSSVMALRTKHDMLKSRR